MVYPPRILFLEDLVVALNLLKLKRYVEHCTSQLAIAFTPAATCMQFYQVVMTSAETGINLLVSNPFDSSIYSMTVWYILSMRNLNP